MYNIIYILNLYTAIPPLPIVLWLASTSKQRKSIFTSPFQGLPASWKNISVSLTKKTGLKLFI